MPIEPFSPLEARCRAERTCRGCGKAKESGMVVCWDCFKNGDDPYKYSLLSLEEWLEVKQKTI